MNDCKDKRMSLAIVDDHALVARLLSKYLQNFVNVELLGIFSSGAQFLSLIQKQDVDIALLDIFMPDMNGLEVAKMALKINPNIKIIFVTAVCNKEVVTSAFKLGAKGFITKSSSIEEIIDAIQVVSKNEDYYSKEVVGAFIDSSKSQNLLDVTQTDYFYKFTQREKEICELLVKGFSTHDIAEKICVSVRTVETHKKNIMAKVGVKSTVALVKFVFENYSKYQLQ